MLKVRGRFDEGATDGFRQIVKFKLVVKFFVSNKNGEAQRRLPLHHFSFRFVRT